MGRIYTTGIAIAGADAQQTLWYVTAPSDGMIAIRSFFVGNSSNETNEQNQVTLQRITTIGSPTATALVAAKHENGQPTASGTYVGDVTASEPSYTANTTIGTIAFATLAGALWEPVERDEWMWVDPDESVGLRLTTTATAFDCYVRVVTMEVGS